MKKRSVLVASAAATLFLTGGAGADEKPMGSEAKVKCEGVNACKGHSDCKTAGNACAGKNGCGGQGFLMMTPEECEMAKAEMEKEEKGEG